MTHRFDKHSGRGALAALLLALAVTACAPQPGATDAVSAPIEAEPSLEPPAEASAPGTAEDDATELDAAMGDEGTVPTVESAARSIPADGAVAGASAKSTFTIAGSVWCKNGTPVKGIWIDSSTGGGEFSEALAPSNKPELAAYASTITAALPTRISIHVGCGGTKTRWGSDLWTPQMTVNGTTRINALCSGRQGVGGPNTECAVPGRGTPGSTTNTTFPPKPNGMPWCTTYAAQQWRAATGAFPGWRGDAHQWDENASAAGWTVVSKPMARSIVVWEPSSTYSAYGHVAWVRSVDHRADGSVWLTVREANMTSGKPVSGQPGIYERVVRHVGGEHYILAPNKSGVA